MAAAGASNEEQQQLQVDAATLEFCQQLPKVELHAHLNGCVRDETLRALVVEKEGTSGVTVQGLDAITSKYHRGLQECFKLFDMIHACTSEPASITRITEEVMLDFARDRCVYLELRTTPKARNGMTKRSYTQAVLDGISRCEPLLRGQVNRCDWQDGISHYKPHLQRQVNSDMTTRLLLSIDRREDSQAAMETVHLAAQLHKETNGLVVGVDLSGNPTLGLWSTWEPALKEAQRQGLGVTLHAAEVPDSSEEIAAMLGFKPGRLGHMCCLTEREEDALLASGIPVELCLTSNIKTLTFAGFPDHHFQRLHGRGHPVSLCTDDSGVFCTTLSQEYAIAMHTFGLTRADMQRLAVGAARHTFLLPAEAEALERRMQAAVDAMGT